MSQLSPCATSFVEKILTDIGVSPTQVAVVISGLNQSLTVYTDNAPTNTPESIILNMYNCSKNHINNAIQLTVQEALNFQILVSVIISVALLIIILALFYLPGEYSVIVVVFILILSIVIVYMIYTNYLANIVSILAEKEKNINTCVSTAIKNIQIYTVQQEAAINVGLCAY